MLPCNWPTWHTLAEKINCMKKRAKGYGARGGAFADVHWALDSVLGMEPGGTDSACVLLLYSEPPATSGSFPTTLGLELPLTSKGPAGHRRFLHIHPGKLAGHT